MAQYALQARNMPRVLDLCDVDSDKWCQYAQRHRWPMRSVYLREAPRLQACERDYARRFDAVLLVSPRTLELVKRSLISSADGLA
jgi:hypothetical protein